MEFNPHNGANMVYNQQTFGEFGDTVDEWWLVDTILMLDNLELARIFVMCGEYPLVN